MASQFTKLCPDCGKEAKQTLSGRFYCKNPDCSTLGIPMNDCELGSGRDPVWIDG